MALDKEYFDGISIEVVKKKYYNANKVNSLLEDIRAQAQALTDENLRLKEELDAVGSGKAEISEVLLSAQSQARLVLSKARREAAAIIRDAQTRAGTENLDAQENAAKCVEHCIDVLKKQQLDNIDALNRQWQEFLCNLLPDKRDAEPCAAEAEGEEPPMDELENRVTAIAKALKEITGKG